MATQKKVLFKVVLVGESGVGKTSLMNQYIYKRFSKLYKATIGADFATKEIMMNEKNVALQIWDTAGQERFQSLGTAFYRGTDACIAVYDISNARSFKKIGQHLQEVQDIAGNDAVILIVGNKIDMQTEREVSTEEGKAFAEEKNAAFIETSAIDGTNLEQMLTEALRKILIGKFTEQTQPDPSLPEGWVPIFDEVAQADYFYNEKTGETTWDRPTALATATSEIDIANENYLKEALAQGKKEWGRSKIMIVGEGRAGKTALANSILGKNYESTDSTIGINEFTCNVGYAQVGAESVGENGSWSELKDHKDQKEYETALARLIFEKKSGRKKNDKENGGELEDLIIGLNEEGGYMEGDRMQLLTKGESKRTDDTSESNNPDGKTIEQVKKGVKVVTETSKGVEIDEALVMQYLGEKKSVESKFIISVFDFGGQSVFNVIHPFFLTRFGVYVLVFNMAWLSSDASKNVREDCRSYLTFWLNSIVIHTQNEKREIAPIFFVGTRKDVINSSAEHLNISTVIYQLFSSNVAWPFVVENHGADGPNGKVDLYFYPIDNTLSNRDNTVLKLIKKMEETIDGSSYVHLERPLGWFQVLDVLKKQNLPFLRYEEASKFTVDCGIPSEKVPLLLKFFHEMGILMWHDEDTLRDVVVFDPIEYFVKPATTIICKHVPDEIDGISHVLEIHRIIRKKYPKEFLEMTSLGIVTDNLLKALLQSDQPNFPYIKQMMLKYGLLVPLTLQRSIDEEDDPAAGEEEEKLYLAPALLPESKHHRSLTEGSISTQFYFLFTPSKGGLGQMATISLEDCSSLGFLPQGLFEKLITKALMWSMKTSDFVSRSTLYGCYKNAAELAFGNQTFRVYADGRHNLISVVVDGANPVGIHDRLRDQLQRIIAESLKSLKFITILRYQSSSWASNDGSLNTGVDKEEEEPLLLFLRLSQIRSLVEKKTALSLNISGGRSLFTTQEAMSLYGPWLMDYTSFEEYDLFLSYRWGQRDSEFTSTLFDRMSLYSVEQSMRSIRTFLDKKRLEVGQNFQYGFMKALTSSLIMIPIVSYDALLRMVSLQAEEEDNVLIEWICGLECIKFQKSPNHGDDKTDTHSNSHSNSNISKGKKFIRLRKIMPVFFGSSPEEGIIRNLFQEKIIDRLPSIVPTACLIRAKELLESNRIAMSGDLAKVTIKGIVQEITKFLFLCAWEIPDKKQITAYVAKAIVPQLNEELIHEQAALLEYDRITRQDNVLAPQPVVPLTVVSAENNSSNLPSLAKLKDMIREECGIESSNPSEVITEALMWLGEEERNIVTSLHNPREKLSQIALFLKLIH